MDRHNSMASKDGRECEGFLDSPGVLDTKGSEKDKYGKDRRGLEDLKDLQVRVNSADRLSVEGHI
ncbi:MAG: hypothetical protein ACOYEQ_09380 [Bacillota bacterium]